MEHQKTIGFIGLGSIGLPIAINLCQSGYKLKVHNRTRSVENNKQLIGAVKSESPYDAAHQVDILMLCVSDCEAVEKVLFGKKGAAYSLAPKSVVIDFSTIRPRKARSFARKLQNNDVHYLDAPVTGGTEGAKERSLSILVGGNKHIYQQILPVLMKIGKSIKYFGSVGKGQEVKAINQILVAGSYAALAEAISLGERLDLPMENVIKSLENGAASSWVLRNRSNSMIEDNYPLGFKLSLHHKDLGIAIETAEELGLNLDLTKLIRKMEEELIIKGWGDKDLAVLKKWSNI